VESMIELIDKEFDQAGYKQLGERLWKHQEFDDFWMICPIAGAYDIEELQENVYRSLEELRKDYLASEKCTSLLILQEIGGDNERNYQKVIDDENNVFYFKKYVIQYTAEEWGAAKALIPATFHGLGELLMRTEVFEHVKLNEHSPYHLLYAIAHKLPFVMMYAEPKEYEPCPSFAFGGELQTLFEWVEGIPNLTGNNPTDAEMQLARNAIDQLINSRQHVQHQN